eukprot:2168858-Karenia_brevis.AAC.1
MEEESRNSGGAKSSNDTGGSRVGKKRKEDEGVDEDGEDIFDEIEREVKRRKQVREEEREKKREEREMRNW